ncbi:voltage-dependent T-type calcium channel subunit alpha-1H-like [Cyprinodon tularosa]|uniref:voltage-dependent T-type calcium channel subunit alpha-1H-like n=1 Tax=Cyprinodon tularosa TaxID=77115 RepID=UPI0018E237A9|nr:voltage-dependent T-type calcium channel subunit alpha-1H-like [Cyprinodon tularosa]
MLSLTVMLSMDSWVRLMYDGVDAVGIDQQPVTNYNNWRIIFFVTFILLSLILVNMFAGVMVDSYSRCHRGRHQLDDMEMCYPELPTDHFYIMDASEIRLKMYRIVNSARVEKFINFLIIFSVLSMGAERYEQSESVEVFLKWVFYISTGLLFLEILLKLYVFGFERYLRKRTNIVDITVALISVTSLVLKELKQSQRIPINPSIFRVLRLFRLVQIARLSIITDLVSLITKTLCEIRSLILLTVLYFYIFAVIGVELFGSIGQSHYLHNRHKIGIAEFLLKVQRANLMEKLVPSGERLKLGLKKLIGLSDYCNIR